MINQREKETLAALTVLRDTLIRLAPQIPLTTLDELQQPTQRANAAIRAYMPEIRADLIKTVNHSRKAKNHSVTISRF
jgi:hypothetical protein